MCGKRIISASTKEPNLQPFETDVEALRQRQLLIAQVDAPLVLLEVSCRFCCSPPKQPTASKSGTPLMVLKEDLQKGRKRGRG